MREVIVEELPPLEFADWGPRVFILVSPRCVGHSPPHGFDGQAYLRLWRGELDAARAAVVREYTARPGFREMIDTIAWSEMR